MSYLDDFFDEQSEIIEKFGWAVVHVVPTEDDPPEEGPARAASTLASTSKEES